MANPEQLAKVSTPPAAGMRLIDARPGDRLVIARLDPAQSSSLTAEGIGEGTAVEVERKLTFGGPLIVRVGRARLALARDVARRIVVERAP